MILVFDSARSRLMNAPRVEPILRCHLIAANSTTINYQLNATTRLCPEKLNILNNDTYRTVCRHRTNVQIKLDYKGFENTQDFESLERDAADREYLTEIEELHEHDEVLMTIVVILIVLGFFTILGLTVRLILDRRHTKRLLLELKSTEVSSQMQMATVNH